MPPDLARFTITTDVINTAERGAALAVCLGKRNAVLMLGHGSVTVGPDVGTAVGAAVHLERACQIQLLAGQHVYATPDGEATFKRSRAANRFANAWTYLDRTTSPERAPQDEDPSH